MTETTAAKADQAREGCPAWCTHHPVRDGIANHGHHRGEHRDFLTPDHWTISVYLHEINHGPILTVDSVPITLNGSPGHYQCETMARLLRKLGREDIAAAVDELAALAGGGTPPTGR